MCNRYHRQSKLIFARFLRPPHLQILEGKTPFDEEPLYLYLAHQAVHPPLGLPPENSFSPEEVAILDAIEANSLLDGDLRKRFAKVNKPSCHTAVLL